MKKISLSKLKSIGAQAQNTQLLVESQTIP